MRTDHYIYREKDLPFYKEVLMLGHHKGTIYAMPVFRVWDDGFVQTYDIGKKGVS